MFKQALDRLSQSISPKRSFVRKARMLFKCHAERRARATSSATTVQLREPHPSLGKGRASRVASLTILNGEPRVRRNGYRSRTVIRFSLALFLLLPFGLLFSAASNGAATTYQIQAASQGTFDVTVYAGGLIQNNVYNLAFQSSSSNIISEIDVKQGQQVMQGQVLVRLNPVPLQDSLDLATASVKVARVNVSSAQAYARSAQDSIDAKINGAEVSADAAQNNQNAVNEQSDTLKQAANAIIQDDQRILDAQRASANALLRHAEILRQQTLDTICSVLKKIVSTPTPIIEITPTSTAAATSVVIPTTTATTRPIGAAASSHLAFPEADQKSDASNNDDNGDNNAYSDCEKQANSQYKVDDTTAHANVVNADEQVDKDQQALDQVLATVKVNNVNAQGQVDVANSLIDVEKSDDDYASALTQVAASQGQLFLALIQVNIAKHNLANTIMIAPHNGVVSGINGTIDGAPGVQPNTAINNGAAPPGVCIQIVDVSTIGQLIVNVGETDILKVKPGQTAQFTIKAFGYRSFTAHVEAISPNGVNNAGSINYPVFLDIDPKSLHGLKPYPNMSASSTMSVVHDNNVLMIPSSALDFSHLMSTSLNPVVSLQQMQTAQHAADTMLAQMTLQNPKLALQPLPPIATFIIEQTGNGTSPTFEARPVVLLGITNGASYEVLQGLMTGEPVVTGIAPAKKTP